MRILIDATAVGEGRGGIVTYLLGLLQGWRDAGFADQFAVAGTSKLPRAIDDALGSMGTVHRLGGAFPGARFVAQHADIPALARRWQPDVILATTPVVPLLARRTPVVAMLHDLRYLHRPEEFGRAQRRYRIVMYRLGLNRARRILTNSRLTSFDAVSAYPDLAGKIATVYLGCDQFPLDPALPTGAHGLAYAHWTNKQPDVAIRAWATLRADRPGFANPLHVVGVGALDRPRLQNLTAESGVADLVHLHDYLDDATYRRLFATARILLMPSTFEGFGLPVIEAHRLGVPVVASANAGMQEAGGDHALYAPADSPAAFAAQCARLLVDDALRQTLIENGRRHAAHFTWHRTAEQTRAVLASVIPIAPPVIPITSPVIPIEERNPSLTNDPLEWLHPLLACPSCKSRLTWTPNDIHCQTCAQHYPIVDGIPVMIPSTDDDSAHKRQQMTYYDEECDAEFEITRPHGTSRLYQWLLAEKFRRSVQSLPGELVGRTALTVCGGSGLDAEYLARAGATVIASDLSLGAARRTRERARRQGLAITPIVADVERLPFTDRAIDLVYVHDGLHHLECPARGLTEMDRVAARAISVTEPARAAATEAAIRLGISQRVEDAGNRVERLAPADISTLLRAHGLDVTHAERYAMYYRHRPGPVFAALSLPGLFPLTRLAWRAANLLLGPVGNKLTVQATRHPESDP